MNANHLKSRNKFHYVPSTGGVKGWVYKENIYFLILNVLWQILTD